jgi:CheY-like chemotaxis protein
MGREDVLKPRILLFEDNDTLRTTLKHLLDDLDYEVHTFSDPGMCPLYYSSNHGCLSDDSCSDIILSDVHMPVETGLEFVKKRLNYGCKIKCRALMSADWNDSDLQYAEDIGCKVFSKPFDLEELLDWLDNCRQQIDQNRILSDLNF